MAIQPSLDASQDRLHELRDAPVTDAWLAEIKKMLASRRGVLAGKAARLAGERACSSLVPDLVQEMTRQDTAFDYLLEVVAEEHPAAAGAALKALSTIATDPVRIERAARVVRGRNQPPLEAVFREEFPSP